MVRHSMRKGGFTLMTAFEDRTHVFKEVSITELIVKNRMVVERVLMRIMEKLEVEEMEHREAFKQDRLADLFPVTLDYCFEKVFAGAGNPGSADGQRGGAHLRGRTHP